jgi:oligopeptide/dipeptide ABC transporter ATP-binding protein
VRGVSFQVAEGETVGIVGESGSGKSVTALSVMRLIPTPPGHIRAESIRLEDREIQKLSERELHKVRGAQMAMVFQDPFTSLNPTMTLGAQVAEPLLLHKGVSKQEARKQVLEMFEAVRLPNPELRYKQYPHEISGGQRQRVMIAIAFACKPRLLIADEPTTALDVTVQAQVLSLVQQMQREYNTGVLMITHDLGVVAEVCDRVLVMYAGQIVESGTVEQIFDSPKHPYTQGLLASLPQIQSDTRQRLVSIPGQPPDLSALPKGCAFYDRCPKRLVDICTQKEPTEARFENGQTVRCFLHDEKREAI